MILGAGPGVLAFLDTTSLVGTGTFDMTSNGLVALIIIAVNGTTIAMNFIFYGTLGNWHTAMMLKQGAELLAEFEEENGLPSESTILADEPCIGSGCDWGW